MDETPPPLVRDLADDPVERSLIDDLRALADDGRTLVEAEVAYQKSRAAAVGSGIRGVAAWGALAALLVTLALFALVTGALLILAPRVGPLAATAIVVGACLLGAAVAALAARRRVRGITHAART